MKKYIGIIYAILSSAAFGMMPIFAKIAYENGSNPTTVLIYRFLLAGLALFVYLKFKGVDIKINRKSFMLLFVTGLLGYTVTTQTLFMSYNYLSAGLSTTLHFIYPVVVCIFGILFLKERVNKGKVASLILAGIGVYSLIAFENQVLSSVGVILALVSGVTYGINVIILGLDSLSKIDNRIRTMYICFGGFVGMLIFGLVDGSIIYKINSPMMGSYIGIAMISTIVSIVLLLKAIEIIGATSASILGTFEPIVSIIMGIILLGESLTFSLIIGTVFILIATVILVKSNPSTH